MLDSFENIGQRKIVILSTSTQGWTDPEIAISQLCLNQIQSEIAANGHTSQIIEIASSTELKKKLAKMNPKKVVIFNWIEEIDNLKYGYYVAPQILQQLNFAYTGNDAQTLINSTNKIKIKSLLKKDGISTPQYITLHPHRSKLSDWNTYPCILKPAHEHCSYGITQKSVVDNQDELMSRAQTLFSQYHQPLLVEEFIDGPEFFVSVWGYDDTEILPPICQDYAYTPDYHRRIYDYVAKWQRKTKTFHRCSRRLSPEHTPSIPETLFTEVSKAVQSTGCKSYCRVDVRVKNNISYIIDINPNPDITHESDFILAAARLGYNYGQAILKLCDLAVKNYQNSLAKTNNFVLPTAPAFSLAIS